MRRLDKSFALQLFAVLFFALSASLVSSPVCPTVSLSVPRRGSARECARVLDVLGRLWAQKCHLAASFSATE
ncbi:hypothetical protein V8F20_004494 [Naviculisporaceae sp. PSN 640]